MVIARVRQAWRGDWGALFAEAKASGGARRGRATQSRQSQLGADVRAIEASVVDGMLSKAVSRARGAMEVVANSDIAGTLKALLPLGAPIVTGIQVNQPGPELRAQLVEAATIAIQRHPKRSSPGPNGSRFEHWAVLAADPGALKPGAELVVDFLLGDVPAEALQANLGARLMALRKPTGGIRPVAVGSVVRRLAAKTACAVCKGQVAGAVGPHQYGVGRAAGCELVHKSITALVDEDSSRTVLAYDAVNAFGSLPHQRVWEGDARRMPELLCTAKAWLGRPTTHVFWDDGGTAHPLEATAGVDQGCPLSPLFFVLGVADALESINAGIRALDRGARVFAYLDDIVVVIQPGQAEAAHNLVRNVLNAHGLTLNGGKTVVWCRDTGQVLPATLARLRKDDLRMLGSDVRFLDRREDREEFGSPVHGSVNGQAVLQAAQGLTRRLRELQAAGLTSKSAYAVLHTYAQSCLLTSSEPTTSKGSGWKSWRGSCSAGLVSCAVNFQAPVGI